MVVPLFLSVLLIAACGLIYELVASALASYLLGDSVTQFSTVIGTYLFAMGVGSWLSRWIGRGLVARFVTIELLVGLVGGFSSTLLFLAFAYTDAFRLLLYVLVAVLGVFVGLEIPLLMRILRDRYAFKDVVANVLTFDYLGALAASLAFPILLVPHLGLVRAALLFGMINAGVALWSVWLFRDHLGARRVLAGASVAVLLLLGAGMVGATRITNLAEDSIYADEVIFARNTRYQRIVLTAWKDDLRLWLNAHLQFSSRDEYRYHEALVHPGLAALPGARRVLVLGGGDGLAARELLRYPNVESITLVDLDPEMTRIFSSHPTLVALNKGSLRSPRVHVINDDAFVWLDKHPDTFDFVVVDFPDPDNYATGKLYTTAFYRLLARHVSRSGLVVVPVLQVADDDAIDAPLEVRDDVAQQVVRHGPRRCHVLDLQRDGVRLENADPDRQDPIAVLILQDHDRHVRHGVHHQALDGHFNQHGCRPCVCAASASPHRLWGPARRIRTGIVRPIQSDAGTGVGVRQPGSGSPCWSALVAAAESCAADPIAGTRQLTTVLPLVRPETSEPSRRLAESTRTGTVEPIARSCRRV